ncbi:glycosyltransferase family 4 protein [Paenibacillus sp. NFR01]|uniref:glycosyltransferase family 4 protein n=1 Tax=Paenibacillus sp. NFR01 TaxID=1566279 RepID=UPI0008BAE961|nr:glycosyltransferase family 4 protein [Paenibacillus sp. NFR01]SET08527.1 1,2-diacylglycerol 3-glucosyltransferase [Paenibacillus sp. NFR01]
MKVLITTDTYSPMVNGVVTSVKNLYKELKAEGHDVRILTLSHSKYDVVKDDVYYVKSIPVGIYPDARCKLPLFNKLIHAILEWRPDIIHSQTEFSMMLVSKQLAHKLKIPLIHTYHTLYENYLGYFLGGRVVTVNLSARITRRMLNRVEGVIAATDKTRSKLLSYGIQTPIFEVPTGIELHKFQQSFSDDQKRQLKQKLGLTDQDRIIAYVGRIALEKNIGEIVAFLPRLLGAMPDVKLLIVGGGPYLDTLKEQVGQLGITDRVVFTGMVRPDEVHQYYKMADLFVNASTSETQGLTYVEALACGCPVVCRYDPCIDGVIEQGINGFAYINREEFTAFCSGILADAGLRGQLSRNALYKAELFSSRVFAKKVMERYVSLVMAYREREIPAAAKAVFTRRLLFKRQKL